PSPPRSPLFPYTTLFRSAIVAKSNALGGTMTLRDLASYKGEWVTPASTSYHGYFTVYGTTAPSQAWGIVAALNILEQYVPQWYQDRKSTRLNSSHLVISY